MSSTNKTAKLKLPQFTATDTPTWLTDVNNAFKAIDDNVGKVTRTATVVVGLESSGYTENQVDVLIKTTDNAGTKVNDIINKLSNLGGEIKFLEGLFDFQGITFFPKKNLTISGVGNSTILSKALWNVAGCDTIFKNLKLIERDSQLILLSRSNCYISNVTFGNSASFISFYESDINSKVFISNCNSISFQNKTASNWRNIFVDGVAEYVALNTLTSLIGTSRELLPTNTFSVGDMIDISIRSSSAIQTSTQLVTMKYGQGSIIIRVGLSNYVPKTNNQYYVGLTVYSNLTNDGVYNYAGTLIDNMLAIDNIKIWRKAQ